MTLKVLSAEESQSEPSVKVHLYQAMPKGDKLEHYHTKSGGACVDSITPVMTRRCVSKPIANHGQKKLERYNRIALEAAKQSGRGKIPQVKPLLDLNEALDEMAETSCPILFYENATAPAKEVIDQAGQEIAVLIGSEGRV